MKRGGTHGWPPAHCTAGNRPFLFPALCVHFWHPLWLVVVVGRLFWWVDFFGGLPFFEACDFFGIHLSNRVFSWTFHSLWCVLFSWLLFEDLSFHSTFHFWCCFDLSCCLFFVRPFMCHGLSRIFLARLSFVDHFFFLWEKLLPTKYRKLPTSILCAMKYQ